MPPISPASVTDYRPDFLPAYLSNGVVGLRVPRVPQIGGVAILNGFVGVDPESRTESFARAPYPLAGDLEIGRLSLRKAPERVVLREQSYDFSSGELRTRLAFEGDDARAELEVLTFCSRTFPMLVLQEVVVSVDRACDLVLAGGVDPHGVPGGWGGRDTQAVDGSWEGVDGSLLWKSHGDIGSCGAAYVTALEGAEVTPQYDEEQLAPLMTRYAFRARTGRRYRLRQVSALVAEPLHHQPDLQAVRLAYGGLSRGFDRVREENRTSWDEIWRGRVELVGAPARWQALADAAYFYLHTSVHPSTPTSMALFGLAYWPDYHYYRGHIMWDIEVFAVPPLILTSPDAARTLLEYRSHRLAAARYNASMAGFRGAQFPWESSMRSGEEAAPGAGTASAHEHHVSLGVSFAFSQFLHATHDWEWGREHAWKVLESVAEWAESRGIETKRGFEIHEVNGIAETKANVNNNAYVNMAAGVAFREAVALARPLGHVANPTWQRLAASIFLPIDRRRKFVRNHDRYRPTLEKAETPEACAGLFPLTFDVPADVERATYEYYLGFADDYVGSPMLSALLGVYAARLGDRARALELFEHGYADFILEPFSITAEYDPKVFPEQPIAGPFTANLGGFLTSLLYGLTGLRIGEGEPQHWAARPVTMPKGWDGIEVERIWARGRPARFSARQGDAHAAVSLEPSVAIEPA